jgi:two-component system sensor histidine kinase AdeS
MTRTRRRRGWRGLLPPWSLTWQITLAFVAAMIVNGLLVSAAMDQWGDYTVAQIRAKLSPAAARALRSIEADNSPDLADFTALQREMRKEVDPLEEQSQDVLYFMLALAALMTMVLGYVILGKLGRGLDNLADAARKIAEGDLAARAVPARFVSREERELIRLSRARSANSSAISTAWPARSSARAAN